ncbi:MAG: hypothetical protein WEA61_00865 [Anaerolineales bacterium]
MPRKLRRSTTASKSDPIAEILDAWRLWLLGGLVGALLGWALYQLVPPDFRARATVVVDNNLEEAWVFFPDRQLFQFLARETERLEELAWSDEVMQAVSQVSGVPVEDLRRGVLQLSQPSDGGWHFYADHADPSRAQDQASAWAQAFVDAARAAVDADPQLQAAREALNAELLSPEPDDARLRELTEQISVIYEQTKGISPYTELSISQAEDLPVERSVSQSTYLFVGSLVGALAAPLGVLLGPKRR